MFTTDTRLLQKVGAKLKALRQQQGMSMEEVKAATGIALADIEAGKKDMKIDLLAVLCEHYRTSLFAFFKEIEQQMS